MINSQQFSLCSENFVYCQGVYYEYDKLRPYVIVRQCPCLVVTLFCSIKTAVRAMELGYAPAVPLYPSSSCNCQFIAAFTWRDCMSCDGCWCSFKADLEVPF